MNYILFSPYDYGEECQFQVNNRLIKLKRLVLPIKYNGVYVYQVTTERDVAGKLPERIKLKDNIYMRYLDTFFILPEMMEVSYFKTIFNHIADSYESLITRELNISIYEYIFKSMATSNHAIRILDFGCGSGLGSEALRNAEIKSSRIQLYGCDIAKNMLVQMSLTNYERYESIHLVQSNLDFFKSEYFDAVVIVFVAHMLSVSRFTELLRLLRPGGRIIFNKYKPRTYRNRYFQLVNCRDIRSIRQESFSTEFSGEDRIVRVVFVTKQIANNEGV